MKKKIIVVLIVLFSIPIVNAQQVLFKALFIYNFTKNIEWPTDYKSGNFIISVVGQDEITNELKKLSETKRVGSQTIEVKLLSNISDVPKSHIVYVSNSKSSSLASVIDYYKKSPTLIISDQGGGCRTGSGINFVIVDGKMKFEIAPQNITSRGLHLSPKLTGLGILIE
ncbi:MAG: YfiR family protein [Marinilabiliaceae bacterium]|nr:YfiR family protein [Marinilabiliaceae bacterium]